MLSVGAGPHNTNNFQNRTNPLINENFRDYVPVFAGFLLYSVVIDASFAALTTNEKDFVITHTARPLLSRGEGNCGMRSVRLWLFRLIHREVMRLEVSDRGAAAVAARLEIRDSGLPHPRDPAVRNPAIA